MEFYTKDYLNRNQIKTIPNPIKIWKRTVKVVIIRITNEVKDLFCTLSMKFESRTKLSAQSYLSEEIGNASMNMKKYFIPKYARGRVIRVKMISNSSFHPQILFVGYHTRNFTC